MAVRRPGASHGVGMACDVFPTAATIKHRPPLPLVERVEAVRVDRAREEAAASLSACVWLRTISMAGDAGHHSARRRKHKRRYLC